jgi:hypothetical protein
LRTLLTKWTKSKRTAPAEKLIQLINGVP